MPKSPLPGQRSDGIAAKDLRVEERMRNRLRKPNTCYEHSSDVCCLLITMSSRCILFAYHLSTVRHEISRLCLHPVNCATLLSFTQPVAVTGRRHLRHRPVDCAVLFFFLHQPEAGTGRRHLCHSRPVDCIVLFSFLVKRDGAGRRHLRHSHPVDALFSLFCLYPHFIYLFVSWFARSVVAR